MMDLRNAQAVGDLMEKFLKDAATFIEPHISDGTDGEEARRLVVGTAAGLVLAHGMTGPFCKHFSLEDFTVDDLGAATCQAVGRLIESVHVNYPHIECADAISITLALHAPIFRQAETDQ